MASVNIRYALRRPVILLYRAWCRRLLRQFLQATGDPRGVQRRVLLDRIHRNCDTDFGKDHKFGEIRSVKDFRDRVPVAPYEYYEKYVERMKAGHTNALLGGRQELVMFALTSGTQSTRKFIPITQEFVKLFRRGWLIWGVQAGAAHPGWLSGKVVQLASDWDEFRTAGGIPCGSVSGLIGKMQRRIVRTRYCVPPEVGRIKDVVARHYTTLRLSLPENATLMTTANPSTLVNLARLGDSEKENLVRDIFDGTLDKRFALPSEVEPALKPAVSKAHPVRARELEAIISRTGRLFPKDYWPELRFIGNWTGGAVRAYLRHYPELFGETPVRDIGLLASEGRMTIPLESGTAAGVLDVTTNYYEFIPEDEIDSPAPTVLEAHELEEDKNYFILLTTPSGFYRYNISDVVRVVGRHHATPVLEFLNKGSHVSSITGEKLSESQVSRAMAHVLDRQSLAVTAFTLAPRWDDRLPYYALVLERGDVPSGAVAERVVVELDRELQRLNPEYESKRETRRLGAVEVAWIEPGSWQRFCHNRLAETGGAAEQYKHPCLVNDFEFVAKLTRMQRDGAAPASRLQRVESMHGSS